MGQKLPWGSDINKNTIGRHTPFILQHLEFQTKKAAAAAACTLNEKQQHKEQKPRITAMPPSFRQSEASRDKRRAKIESVKRKLNSEDEKKVDLDMEEITIEKLLKQGYKEEQILELSINHPLPSNWATMLLDTELSEQDIPDCELDHFIKSPTEIEKYLDLQQQPSSKKPRLSTDETDS